MFLMNLRRDRSWSIERSHLLVYVLAIIARHLHAPIVIIEGRVRHLQCFLGDGGDTSQVSLITLILQNGLLPQLDPIFLFEFADHRLEELKLQFLFLHFGLDLDGDLFFDAAFVHAVTSDLGEEFHVADGTLDETSLVEVVAEL